MAKIKKEKKVKTVVPLEKDIQREVCQWLDNMGFFFWRSNNIPVFGMNNGGKRTFRSLPKYTPRGICDIIIVHEGVFIGIEVKRPKAKLRPEQVNFMEDIIQNGGQYHVVTSLQDIYSVMGKYVATV
jgi:hypothetical protein